MKVFKEFFIFEWKRFWSKKNLAIVVLFAFVALCFVQIGIGHYKAILEENEEVAKIEREAPETIRSYAGYAIRGINMKISPPPISIFFYNSGIYRDLIAHIDAGEYLDIFSNLQGKSGLFEQSMPYSDFSGWIMMIGTLLLMFYGRDAFRNIGFFKMVNGLVSIGRLYWFTLISRTLNAFVSFLMLIFMAVLLLTINGIYFSIESYSNLLLYCLVWLLISFFFLILGSLIGMISKKSIITTAIVVTWILFIYLVPIFFNKVVAMASYKIPSSYSIKYQKWNLLNDFEIRAKKEHGDYSPKRRKEDKVRKTVESFLNREYKEILKLDKDLNQDANRYWRMLQKLSLFSPSTIYSSIVRELSGKGISEFNNFFDYMLKFRNRFSWYFFDKKYYSDDKKVESFVKTNENIYSSNSRLPEKSFLSLVLLTIYLAVIHLISFHYFRHLMLKIENSAFGYALPITVEKSNLEVYYISHKSIIDFYFLLLSNKSGNCKKSKLNQINDLESLVNFHDKTIDVSKFQYICPPTELPGDAKVVHILDFMFALNESSNVKKDIGIVDSEVKGFNNVLITELSMEDKSKVLMEVSRFCKAEIYFFDNTVTRMTPECTNSFLELLKEMKSNGTAIFYFTTDDRIDLISGKKSNMIRNESWEEDVEKVLRFKKRIFT
jgi:hypothetical protein